MSGDYQGVYGFTFTSTQTSGVNVNQAIFMTGHDYTFAENTIYNINPDCSSNGGGGIQVANGVYNYTIDANLIYNIGTGNSACASSSVVQVDGILAESTGAGAVLTNNIVWGVYGGWGIMFGNSSGDTAPGIIAKISCSTTPTAASEWSMAPKARRSSTIFRSITRIMPVTAGAVSGPLTQISAGRNF